jgi:hypothetical protein
MKAVLEDARLVLPAFEVTEKGNNLGLMKPHSTPSVEVPEMVVWAEGVKRKIVSAALA